MKAEDVVKISKPGIEWLVELRATDPTTDGGEAVCGMLATKNEDDARSYHALACRIINKLVDGIEEEIYRELPDYPRNMPLLEKVRWLVKDRAAALQQPTKEQNG